MNIRSIVLGIVVCFVMPMAGSNAGVVFDVGLNQASASTNFELSALNTAESFGRDNCDRSEVAGDHEGHCCHHEGRHDGDHDRDDRKCCDGDHTDSKTGNGEQDHDHDHDHDCHKSKSKP